MLAVNLHSGKDNMTPTLPLLESNEEENSIPLIEQTVVRPSKKSSDYGNSANAHGTTATFSPTPSNHVKSPDPSLLQVWWVESLCCIVVFGALLAIWGTLYPFQGKPLPDWPYGLSINTLIAIYVTILKVAMIFVVTEGKS